MNMSEKVGRIGQGLYRESTFYQTAEKTCGKAMLYMMIFFFYDQKGDMTSSVAWSKRFEWFSSFLKYLLVINWQFFAVFLNNSLHCIVSE